MAPERWTWAGAAAMGLVYGALSVWWTWPLAAHLPDHVVDTVAMHGPFGWLAQADILLVVWALAWDLHALLTAPLRILDANIFWPADAAEGHHHGREQRHECQVDGAERLEQRGEHEARPRDRPAAPHGALGGEEHERQVHRRVQLEVSELRRPPGREAEEEAAEGAGHDAARPRAERHVHGQRRERKGEQEDGLMREERVPGRELQGRRERQVADEVVGAR